MTITSLSINQNYDLQELDELRAHVSGQVITPNEDGYDTARQAWNLAVNQHPALIVIAQNAGDIVEAVHFLVVVRNKTMMAGKLPTFTSTRSLPISYL